MAWRPPPLSVRARLVLIALFLALLAAASFSGDAGGSYVYGRPARSGPLLVVFGVVIIAAIWSMGRERRR